MILFLDFDGVNREAIREIVAAHRGLNPRVFGSVLNGEDTEESDLDILVDRAEGMTLLDLGAMISKIQKLLGVPVDVLTPGALPDKWRDRIIAEAKPALIFFVGIFSGFGALLIGRLLGYV